MTDLVYLRLDKLAVAHGFRPGLTPGGRHPTILAGNSREHQEALADYQAAVRHAAAQWLDDIQGRWPHHNQALAVGALIEIPRPTTYRMGERWHRTNRPGDLTTLIRSAEDALQGTLYLNDGQIAAHYTAKTVIDRGQQPAVHLWVTHADRIDLLVAAVNRRLPIRQGPGGMTRNSADAEPVISEARSSGAPSIPGQSSPPHNSPSVSSFGPVV